MTYFTSMKAVLQLDETVYPEIMAGGKFVWYCIINVLTLGVIHSLSLMIWAGMLASPEPAIRKLAFLGAGAGLAFVMHAATALYLWVFTRGAGGRVEFIPVYFNVGIAAIGLWPFAPVLAAIQTGSTQPLIYGLLALTSLYGLAVIFFAAKSASQLNMAKMAAAMIVCIIVISSMLYLWL